MSEEGAREVNRIQKVSEGANIKLASVISDVLGVSGTRMLEALARGERIHPARLAALADVRLRATPDELAQALDGLMASHQQFLLASQLQHLTALDQQIATLDAEVARRLAPLAETEALIESHPGMGKRAAEVVLNEVGGAVDGGMVKKERSRCFCRQPQPLGSKPALRYSPPRCRSAARDQEPWASLALGLTHAPDDNSRTSPAPGWDQGVRTVMGFKRQTPIRGAWLSPYGSNP